MSKTKTAKPRNYSRNRILSRNRREVTNENDTSFLLKLVFVTLLSTVWIRFADPVMLGGLPFGAIPLGAVVAILLITRLEHYQFNRKIWYTVVVLMTVITYVASVGIVV